MAILFVALWPPVVGLAQLAHVTHRIPGVPSELLQRPIPLSKDIGSAHDVVDTKVARAQAYYDQGLAYLHSYAWIDAARSFNEALRVDPGLAMAHVGLTYAHIELNQPAESRAALERARKLASSDHDRTHVELRALQMAAESAARDATKPAAYRKALDDALTRHANDAELWLLRGVAESPDPADRGQGSTAGSIRFYEQALTVAPGHFAAHHYLAHAYENTGRIAEALRNAETYARLAPAVPHALHMHGHSLRRSGRIHDAIARFQKAHELETAASRVADVPPEYDWHHQHNLDLLATSNQYVGRIRKAGELLERSFQIPSFLVIQEFNKHEWPAFLLARGRAKDALAAAQALSTHPSTLVAAIGHVMRGRALIALGRLEAAADASNEALRTLRRTGPEAALAAPYLKALQGELLLHSGQREKAKAAFREVRTTIRARPGPDAWSQGLFRLESIGRAAVAAGAWDLAADTAQDLRAHDPSYGGTHFLLALVAEHNGRHQEAVRELELAEGAWKDGDPDFADLADVKRRLVRLRKQAGGVQ